MAPRRQDRGDRVHLLAALLASAAALALGFASCFSFSLPRGAQITCSAADRWCPSPLICCDNKVCVAPGECGCAEGVGTCAIDNAIDCEAGAICSRGCWAPCESCKQACTNPDLRPCQIQGAAERWYCPRAQTCLVKVIDGYVGACHSPPQQCEGAAQLSCSCLSAPFATQPPCAPWEACNDEGYPGCVACEVGGVQSDSLDSSVRYGGDGSLEVFPDAGMVFSGGPQPPDCFESIGSGPGGERCCGSLPSPAAYDESSGSWDCGRAFFAQDCAGFDGACLDADTVTCDTADPCVWSWWDDGSLHCAADGPPSPCIDGVWQCVAGTALQSTCD